MRIAVRSMYISCKDIGPEAVLAEPVEDYVRLVRAAALVLLNDLGERIAHASAEARAAAAEEELRALLEERADLPKVCCLYVRGGRFNWLIVVPQLDLNDGTFGDRASR